MQRLIPWAVPVLFGVFVYLAIDAYGPSEYGYNRQVAGYATTLAATLLLWSAFSGCRVGVIPMGVPVAFVLSVVVSTWGAPNLHLSVNRVHLYYAALLLGLAFYLAHRGNATAAVGRYFTVIPIVHTIFLVYVVFWLISIQSDASVPASRFPYYANIRHFAYHGFIAASCATSLFIMSRRLELTAFVLTTAALFGIVLLGARGALLAWWIFVIFIMIYHDRRARLLAFCVAAMAVAAGAVWYLTETGLLRVTTLFGRFGAGEDSAFRMGDRIQIWIDTLRAFSDRPWFGFGPEGFILSRCCNALVAQPHNVVLQFLIELGMIGFALMIASVWLMLRACGGFFLIRENLSADRWLLAVCAVLTGFVAYAMIDGLLYHAIPLVHFVLFAALLLAGMTGLSARHR